ncbi:MAG: heme exporter protein CcmB [Deltaproteobacteria bacterium]
MGNYLKKVFLIAAKDLRIEFRSKEKVYSMFIFSLLVMVIFNFAFEPGASYINDVAPGVLWVAFTFAASLGLSRSFMLEKEEDCMQGLMLSPLDRSGIYLGKFLGNFFFTIAMEVISLPFFAVFFNLSLVSNIPSLMIIIFLATFGFIAVGTLFSALSVGIRGGEMILPLLLFPMQVPVIISAVKATGMIMAGMEIGEYANWLKILVAFDIIFFIAPFVIFEYLIEE